MKYYEDIAISSNGLDHHTKNRICQATYSGHSDMVSFNLDQTKRWFDLAKFWPMPGYSITTENGAKYIIADVAYHDRRPRRATIIARRDSNVAPQEDFPHRIHSLSGVILSH